jgi:thiamine-monophosphate kinase
VNEDQLIARIRRMPWPAVRGLSLGIGDDCAIYRPAPGEELVFTTDLFLENVHFRLRGADAGALGRRALARSLSDIAAMGAAPRFCLISLAVSPRIDARWVERFYRGVLRLATATGTTLAGGDLSHARQITCDVMVCGAAPRGKALRRDGARDGDAIYVSGPLGGWTHRAEIVPRLDVGRRLIGRATAAMDISDGLSTDLHRLCVASALAADLDRPLPILEGATLDEALHSGEDYELLYTAPARTRVPGHRIGTMIKGRPGAMRFMGLKLAPQGYDHLSASAKPR